MIGLRFHGWAALLVVVAVLAGCSTEPATGTVEGIVNLNGQPLDQGLIRFVPADGKSQPADGTITAGKFTATVPLGDFKVEITSPKVVGKTQMMPGSPEVDKIQEALPARYNVKTELKATVPKGKSQMPPFELKSP